MIWFLLFLIFIFLPVSSFAQTPEFSTDLSVSYTFSASGSSKVKEDFTVTNLTSQYLISSYDLDFPNGLPENLQGFDSRGRLVFQPDNFSSGKRVRVLFNDVIAGKDRSLNFYLTYSGPTAAQKDEAWQIVIPRILSSHVLNSYKILLEVPPEYGSLIYSSVSPETELLFSNTLISDQGLTAIFSHNRIFAIKLEYELANSESSNQTFYINLPTDTTSQKIYLKSFSPEPENVIIDSSGHWQGQYTLPPKSFLLITVFGQVYTPDFEPLLNLSELGQNPINTVLSPDSYIPHASNVSLLWHPPWQIFPFLATKSFLEIKNTGSNALYKLPLNYSVSGFHISLLPSEITELPPNGSVKIPFSVFLPITQIFHPKSIILSSFPSSVTYNVSARYFLVIYVILTFIASLTFISIASFAYHTWSLFIQKRRKSPLRR